MILLGGISISKTLWVVLYLLCLFRSENVRKGKQIGEKESCVMKCECEHWLVKNRVALYIVPSITVKSLHPIYIVTGELI